MPRLELTQEEAEIIYRHRENQRFYLAGKKEILKEIQDFMETGEHTYHELGSFFIELTRKYQ